MQFILNKLHVILITYKNKFEHKNYNLLKMNISLIFLIDLSLFFYYDIYDKKMF